MATQVIQLFKLELSKTFRLVDTPPNPAWTISGSGAPALARSNDCACDADVADGSFALGITVAFVLELTMAFAVYGIWRLWLFLR